MEAHVRPLRADAARNRARVLDAARTAFAEAGLDVGVEEIARRAGVGKGTLYRRFPTKEALVCAIFEDILLEFDTSSHPFRNELTDLPLRQKQGWVEIPQKPGLGIDVNRKTLEKYAA